MLEELNRLRMEKLVAELKLIRAKQALEAIWLAMNKNEEIECVDDCPNQADNEHWKFIRRTCKLLGVKGNYCVD